MTELDAIVQACLAAEGVAEGAVLATVLHVAGSAYRRPGARMLIRPGAERIGSISGGCLEGDLVRKAAWLTAGGQPALLTYDTREDSGDAWEFGLGCNGVISVLVERAAWPQVQEMFTCLERSRAAREPAVVVTVVEARSSSLRPGDRLVANQAQAHCGALAGSPIASQLTEHIAAVLRLAQGRMVRLDAADVALEYVPPPRSLVIFGAGDDAVPLARMAATDMGWKVTVADGRPAFARPERFPGAAQVRLLAAGADPLAGLDIDAATAVVVMTHNYPLDVRLAPAILEANPRYVGLLGPRHRAERLFTELGRPIPPSVHAPVGLDLGGDTPSAVALSILAEVQAVLHGRPAGLLRDRGGAIHEAVSEVGEPPLAGLTAETSRPAYCETLAGSCV